MKYPLEKQIRLSAGSFAFVALALSSRIAVADQAVLVAVQKYPNLDSRANQLKGCLNDATAMKAVLEQRGFQVTLLTNEKATKQGILDALEAARKSAKPNEEFVFYFSGHGTNSDGDSAISGLLPSDISIKKNAAGFRAGLLTQKELYNAMRVIPTAHRTAIMDACYSGGLIDPTNRLKMDAGRIRAARFYEPLLPRSDFASGSVTSEEYLRAEQNREGEARFDTSATAGVPKGVITSRAKYVADGRDVPTPYPGATPEVIANPAVDYLTAAQDNQKAYELDDNGETHGAFTYFLLQQVKDSGTKKPWGDIFSNIKKNIELEKPDMQTPVISSRLRDKLPFSVPSEQTTAPPSAPKYVWDMFLESRPDPSIIRLEIPKSDENVTQHFQNDKIGMRVAAEADGYLVILGRDAKDEIYVFFPDGENNNTLERVGKLVKGQRILFPVEFLDTGIEKYKCILFKNKVDAEALLQSVGAGVKNEVSRRTKINGPALAGDAFVTSEFFVEVLERPKSAQ